MSMLLNVALGTVTAPSPACISPRRIYIDMGTNWCNTLKLFQDLSHPKSMGGMNHHTERSWYRTGAEVPWQVVGFEASPLVWPYANKYVQFLNGERQRPLLCVPPTGSSRHLSMYNRFYGCDGQSCIFRKLEKHFKALKPDPELNSSALVETRLRDAIVCNEAPEGPRAGATNESRFTFVPAAVGASAGWMNLYSPPRQLIRGGAVDMHGEVAQAIKDLANTLDRSNGMVPGEGARLHNYRVPVVDVVTWMERELRPIDFVILKMDVEGAEQAILEAILKRNLLRRIDILSLEGPSPLRRALKAHTLRGGVEGAVNEGVKDNGAVDEGLLEALRQHAPHIEVVLEECRDASGKKVEVSSPIRDGPTSLARCPNGILVHGGIDSASMRNRVNIPETISACDKKFNLIGTKNNLGVGQ